MCVSIRTKLTRQVKRTCRCRCVCSLHAASLFYKRKAEKYEKHNNNDNETIFSVYDLKNIFSIIAALTVDLVASVLAPKNFRSENRFCDFSSKYFSGRKNLENFPTSEKIKKSLPNEIFRKVFPSTKNKIK